MSDDRSDTEILREMKADWSKCVRLAGENETGEEVVWYIDYRGESHWRAFKDHGGELHQIPDDFLTETQVKKVVGKYDDVTLGEWGDFDE